LAYLLHYLKIGADGFRQTNVFHHAAYVSPVPVDIFPAGLLLGPLGKEGA
jgi:hypothetical protein